MTTEKTYTIAAILTVPAASYAAALDIAEYAIKSLEVDAGMGCSLVRDYEHDNQGNRVVYLSSEEGGEMEAEDVPDAD